MSVLKLLDELEEVIESCANLPLSGKALIDRNDFLDILKEIRIVLPDEIKQAQWIKQERSSILEEAQNESESMIEKAKKESFEMVEKAKAESAEMMSQAEEHVRSLIENDIIVKESTKKAKGIIQNAEETAEEIKTGSLKYSDAILKNLQKNISDILETLESNRIELKNMKEK